jgi:branched-subunit amino acid transport protein
MMLDTNILIFCMAIITFACRYLFFMKSVPLRISARTKRMLSYTAPSVLTAMWVPIVFLGHRGTSMSLESSPFLYAGLITLVLSLFIRNTLVVVGFGTAAFAVTRWLV